MKDKASDMRTDYCHTLFPPINYSCLQCLVCLNVLYAPYNIISVHNLIGDQPWSPASYKGQFPRYNTIPVQYSLTVKEKFRQFVLRFKEKQGYLPQQHIHCQ